MIELDIQETLSPISPEVGSWFPIPKPGQVNSEARIRLERIAIPDKVMSGLKGYIRKTLTEISGYSKPELDGIVVGLSGGVDSATTTALCREALCRTRYFVKGLVLGRGPEGEQGSMNPVEYQDVCYAIQSAKDMGIGYHYVDINPLIDSVKQVFPNFRSWELSGILPRLRSALLYQFADSN